MAAPQDEDPPGAPDWIVTFTDLVSLLVAFFVLLMTFSSLDSEDAFVVQGDLLGTRGTIQDPGGASATDPPDLDVMQAMDSARGAATPHSRPTESLRENLDEMGIKKTDEHVEIDLKGVKDGVVLHFSEEACFAPGSAKVNADLRKSLGEIGRVLENYSHMVTIEGFTDTAFQPTPEYGTSEELSFARAAAAADIMLMESKLSPKLVQLAGMGTAKPLNRNDTPLKRKLNRRIELRVLSMSEARNKLVKNAEKGR